MKNLLCSSLKKSDLPLKTAYLNLSFQLINHLHNFTFSNLPKKHFLFLRKPKKKKKIDFQLRAPNNDELDQGVAFFGGWGARTPQQ